MRTTGKTNKLIEKTRGVVLALLVTLFYGLYSRLWRVKHVRKPKLGTPILYAHWHGDELFLIGAHIGSGLAAMVSRSRDGEMLQYILKWFGYRVVRGSSSKGGAGGLKGLIDVVRTEERSASMAVDGPRGPIYQVKPGIIKLASETGCPIVGGGASVCGRYVFQRAWNRCYLPYPFTKGVVVYTDPIYVPKELTPEQFEFYRSKVENELKKVKREAEEVCSHETVLISNPVTE